MKPWDDTIAFVPLVVTSGTNCQLQKLYIPIHKPPVIEAVLGNIQTNSFLKQFHGVPLIISWTAPFALVHSQKLFSLVTGYLFVKEKHS